MALARLLQDLDSIHENPLEFGSAAPTDDDIFLWRATIFGPPGTPYDGGIFNLEIKFPENFPENSPNMVFKTPIYHPNINSTGVVGLYIHRSDWDPATKVSEVLFTVYSLLNEPNTKTAMVPRIATQYDADRNLFETTAREWTEKHAM